MKKICQLVSTSISFPKYIIIKNNIMNTLEIELVELNKILEGYEIIKPEDILTESRQINYIYIRAIVVYFLRKKKYSLNHIGKLINKAHCTVLYSLKYYYRNPKRNVNFDSIIRRIDASIENQPPPDICPHCKQPITK